MRLLFDQNVSRALVQRLADVYPDSSHVALVGRDRAEDRLVWNYAVEHGHVLVSKDEDFHQRALVEGPPPKVVWVRLGNCSTGDIERVLRDGRSAIEEFVRDEQGAFLALG